MPRSILTSQEWHRLLAKLSDEDFDRYVLSGALARRMHGDGVWSA